MMNNSRLSRDSRSDGKGGEEEEMNGKVTRTVCASRHWKCVKTLEIR